MANPNLTEYNEGVLEYYKAYGQPGSHAGVSCPSCGGEMVFRSETILSNQLNLPAKREVECSNCGRIGVKLMV